MAEQQAQRDATESAFTEEERAVLLRFADVAESNAAATTEPVKSSWALKARALRHAAEPRVQRDAMPGANAALIAEARRQAGLAGYSLEGNTLTALATALAAAESRAQTLAAFAKRVLADDAATALREGEATP